MDPANTFHTASQELPSDARTRRLAVTILTNRAIAQERERDVIELLGDEAAYVGGDLVQSATSEVAAQLLLTEHLISQGWQFSDILRSVWYREDALREVVRE